MEDIKYKKQYGQNFIYDPNLLKALVKDSQVSNENEVLEIGVGAGTLTKFLCESAKKVVCYEIDTSLRETIEKNLLDYSNYEIVFKDIMDASEEEINQKFSSNFKIVANLPYYITSPIIFKFLEGNYNLSSLAIMVQKEVAERICSKEKTKDYGVLSVMVQAVADCQIVREINRKMFTPVPNVDSSFVVININRNKFDIKNKEEFRSFVRSCFSMRRKTLVNNLKSFAQKEKLIYALSCLNLKENVRAEEIEVAKIVKLFNILSQ